MTRIKPAYKTTEFWFTLVSFVFSGLFLVGVLTDNEHKDELIDVTTHAVESIIMIGGQIALLYRYTKSRSRQKEEYYRDIPSPRQQEEIERAVRNSKENKKKKKKKKKNKKPKEDHDGRISSQESDSGESN